MIKTLNFFNLFIYNFQQQKNKFTNTKRVSNNSHFILKTKDFRKNQDIYLDSPNNMQPPNSNDQSSFTKYFLEDPSLVQHLNDKQQKKIILYDLPQIQQYRKLNKPVVSEEKKRIIKEKLDLEQESLLQTKQREKRNQFFLNYSSNPFVDLQPHLKGIFTGGNKTLNNTSNTTNLKQASKTIQTSQPGDKQNLKDQQFQQNISNQHQASQNFIYDIVFELNALRQKNVKPQFIKMKDDFRNLKKNADLLSNKIIQLSSKKQDFDFFREKKIQSDKIIQNVLDRGLHLSKQRNTENTLKQSPSRNRSSTQQGVKQGQQQSYNNPILNELPENIMTFEQIIQIKQQNFFMKPTEQHRKLNIFKLCFNKNQKQMIGKQLLNKYYFSFTSMLQKLQKIKIPIYRDISRMARKISLNVSTGKQDRFDYMDSYELSFKTNQLTFVDLMSVASGRFTPQFVSRTTNFDVEQNIIKQKSQTSSQQEQEQIYYQDYTKNVSVRYYNQGQQQQQITNYKKLQFNSRQQQYKSQCQKYKKSILGQLEMKEKLVSTTIQDRELHGVIDRSIKKQMKEFVKMDQKEIQVDRLIRMNKSHKNKNVSIKLEKILEAFQQKKQHDQVIHKLGILPDQNQEFLEENQLDSERQKKAMKRIKQKISGQRISNGDNKINNKNTTPQKVQKSVTPQKVTPNKTTNGLSSSTAFQNAKTAKSQMNLTPTKFGNSTNNRENKVSVSPIKTSSNIKTQVKNGSQNPTISKWKF